MVNLAALPTEVLDLIAKQENRLFLLDLRLVCRNLRDAVDDAFLDTFFTTRHHVYSLRGLQTLVDITSRPQLIKKLKEIKLSVLEVRPDLPSCFLENDGLLALWRQELTELYQDDGDLALLVKTFSQVAAIGRLFNIIVNDDDDDDQYAFWGVYGYNRPTQSSQLELDDNGMLRSGEPDRAVGSVLRAISTTEVKVHELKLCSGLGGGLRDDTFHLPFESLRGLTVAVEHLKSLDIHFREIDTFTRMFMTQRNCVLDILRATTALENIRVDVLGTHWGPVSVTESDIFTNISDALAAGTLRSASISGVHTSTAHLIKFFAHFRGTLADLRLIHIYLPNTESWISVMKSMVCELELRDVELDMLFEGDEPLISGFWRNCNSPISFKVASPLSVRGTPESIRCDVAAFIAGIQARMEGDESEENDQEEDDQEEDDQEEDDQEEDDQEEND